MDKDALACVRQIEVVADYWCPHKKQIMPFYGSVSVLIDRDQGSIKESIYSWPNWRQCHGDRSDIDPSKEGKCRSIREEHLNRLHCEVELMGLHKEDCELSREFMEELAGRLGKKRWRVPKFSGVKGKVRGLLG